MERRSVSVSDGAELSYLSGGSGHPLIMIPGWSQSAAEFKHQFDDLARVASVRAFDMRGHGESATPESGYRIQRLAKDLHDVIVALDLDEPDLLGHSMGCSIIWSYLSMFGKDRPPRRLLLIDQAPAVTAQPSWTEKDRADYGCLFPDFAALSDFEDAVRAATTLDEAKELLRGMFTASIDEGDLEWIASENLKLPRNRAAHLLHDHCILDWRSEIRGIDLPTLVVGAEASIFSAASQRWIGEQISGSQVEIFPSDDGGSHFMFFENPARFNSTVAGFLAR